MSSNTSTLVKDHMHEQLHHGFGPTFPGPEEMHDCSGQFFSGGIEWLRLLGSNTKWLKKLTINLDALCPADGWHRAACFQRFNPTGDLLEILSLVRLAWESNGKLEIVFVHPQAEAHQYSESEHGVDLGPSSTRIDALLLTDVLRAMNEDQLHIRPHDFLFHSIAITRDAAMGNVTYKSNNRVERRWSDEVYNRYSISDLPSKGFPYTPDHGLVLAE
jgi:hypothetical protein